MRRAWYFLTKSKTDPLLIEKGWHDEAPSWQPHYYTYTLNSGLHRSSIDSRGPCECNI